MEERRLNHIVWLLAANLALTSVFLAVLALGFLPKAQRALDATERVEARFQSFADDVQPVLKAGSGKAVEAIEGMDSVGLSEKANEVVDAAADRAKRALEKDKERE
jgi:hypothetical protein